MDNQAPTMRTLTILFLALLLSGCNTSRPVPELEFAPVTGTPGTEAGYTQCTWIWATQPLPDLTAKVQSAVEVTGLKGVTISAEAYGENCITGTGEVDHFAAMETDFRFTVQVDSLNDRTLLGTLLEQIMVILDGFPTGSTPGSNAGYIGVTFQAGIEELHLWFNLADGKSVRVQGLHGAALLDKLQKR
jgi:hypothetical protein